MELAFLDPDWARSLCRALNAHPAYGEQSASWTHGPLLLGVAEEGATRYLRLDLHAGRCRGVTLTDTPDPEAALVLTGPRAAWRRLLEERRNPAVEIGMGRLAFEGNYVLLTRYAASARTLVEVAAGLDTAW